MEKGNTNNLSGKCNAACEAAAARSEETRMRAVCGAAQWNKFGEMQLEKSSIERALDNSDIITMSFSDGLKIDFEHDLFYNSNVDESDNEVDVEELSTPGPTPPPDVDLTPMWTEWPMVKHILERHDQRVEDIIRQLDLLHEPMPEYKYYHDEFFQAE